MYTRKWSRRNVRKLYSEGLKESADAIKRQYAVLGEKSPSLRGWTAVDDAAVAASQANIDTLLMEAVDAARQHMQTEIQQAALRATEEAMTKGQATQLMQAQLIQALKAKGIESVSYVRNGRTCYMQLDAYAELVARTTEHEIRNTANINLGDRIGNHLVRISSHSGACPICTPYQGRVYSTDMSDERYPYLYDTPFSREYQNFHPRCRHVATQYIEELHTPEENARMREFSNRGFDVGGSGWTKKQAEAAEKGLERYRLKQARNRRLYEDQKQYARYRLVLGDDAPKTFSVFRRIKAADGERWRFMELDYRRRNKLLEHPELALPNAEKATAADAKFTKYLFNKNNADGWAKGRAFESRLGYNISNWKELQKELINRAQLYTAKEGKKTEFGVKYTQFMVLYGNKGKPANVKVGWIVASDTDTHLTTAFIEEVK